MCVLKSGSDDEVTCIATGDTNDRLAVGYADGRVLLFNLAGPGSLVVTFAGHSSAITTLQYDSTGMLVSLSLTSVRRASFCPTW